ncbi:MAG TPA: hypothetical protein DIT46_03385 [Gemmatimonadetes bacterium]|nr:hypothetical protein [Gemmatimonadota bacterium]
MHTAEAVRQVCENLGREIQAICPPGIGRWNPAWDLVASADVEFMLALFAWEDQPSEELEAQVRYWGDELMERWREAARRFEEAHRAGP